MEYKHFSHSHTLTLHKVQAGQQFHCHGCSLPCHDTIFSCWNCNFFLHEHCGNAGRHVQHPSHTLHPLVLVPSPTYCSGSFLCNACGAPGTSFSYCCTLCEVDLHLHCAFLPPKLSHNAHHHELYLSFGSPERLSSNDHCKMCAKELSTKHWSYFCGSDACFFRVHTFCATSEVQAGQYEDDQNTSACQARVQTELTPEEIVLEMSRLKLELQMAQALSEIIAYPHLI